MREPGPVFSVVKPASSRQSGGARSVKVPCDVTTAWLRTDMNPQHVKEGNTSRQFDLLRQIKPVQSSGFCLQSVFWIFNPTKRNSDDLYTPSC